LISAGLCPDPIKVAYSTPLTTYMDFRGLLLREGRMGGKGKREEDGKK